MFSVVIGNEVGLEAGRVTMNLGNTHLYEEHLEDFAIQAERKPLKSPEWKLNAEEGMKYKDFRPNMIELEGYEHLEAIKYLLKA